MRKIVALFFAFLVLSSLSASVSLSVDLASLDFLWKEDLRIDAECSFDYDNIRITIPIRYGLSEDKYLNLLESGILVGVFPFENLGLMVEASLFKLGYFWGLASPTDRLVLLSEGSIGWNGNIGMLHICPRLTFRSLLSISGEGAEAMKRISQFDGLRLSLAMGVNLGEINN